MLDDRAVAIPSVKEDVVDASGRSVGIVWPVYFWGIPTMVGEFVRRTELRNFDKVFSVCTYGESAGSASKMLEKCLSKKGIGLGPQFEVRMPDNYVLFYDVPDDDEQQRLLNEADRYIGRIPEILADGAYREKHPLRAPMATAIGYPWHKHGRRTKRFHVTDDCVGCSICETACQMGVIEIRDGRPHWKEKRCERCLACVHRCPQSAIQIGRSQKFGRYLNPNVGFE
jgi:NAD-dependent dihydropyrimidine dehydrogenase PreA subunit